MPDAQDATAAIEALLEADAKARDAGVPSYALPSAKWAARGQIARLEKQYNDGESAALLEAICLAARAEIALPEWVALAYLRCYRKLVDCETDRLDVAFGRFYPKGKHMAAARKRRHLGPKIYCRIMDIVTNEPRTPIDLQLFVRVGEEFNIGKTLCAEVYSEYNKMVAVPPPEIRAFLEPFRIRDEDEQ